MKEVLLKALTVVVVLAVIFSSQSKASGNIEPVSSKGQQIMTQRIQSIFDREYRNNRLNPKIKNINVSYRMEENWNYGMYSECHKNSALINYDLYYMASSDVTISAVLAHELGHCYYQGKGDKELAADNYGFKLFKAAGHDPRGFLSPFDCGDNSKDPKGGHPSDKERCENIKRQM